MTAEESFSAWLEEQRQKDGMLPKGTVCGALSILDRLRKDFVLDYETHTAKAGTQVKTSGPDVKRILEEHGETRKYASEGGRTNRGLLSVIRPMLKSLEGVGLEEADAEERASRLWALQELLVAEVRAFFDRKRLPFTFDPTKSTFQFVKELLETAGVRRGAVAQHLVGAKLELRFPGVFVSNESSSTADVQTGRSGDFTIGDTVFHVTVSPMPGVYDKCKENLAKGLRPFLLVSESLDAGTRQYAAAVAEGRIAVASIEVFVSQNLEEVSVFSGSERARQFARFLEIYNRRVEEVETDKGLMIEIPDNLLPYLSDETNTA